MTEQSPEMEIKSFLYRRVGLLIDHPAFLVPQVFLGIWRIGWLTRSIFLASHASTMDR